MPVDAEQARILQEHLRGKSLVCPLCSNQSWHLVEVVSLPTESAGLLTHPNVNRILSPKIETAIFGEGNVPNFTGSSTMLMGKDTGRRLPVAIIACSNCFYLVQLAWLPIVGSRRRG
jgi:hypothetical protein